MKVGELFTVLGMDFSQFNKDEAVAKSRVEGLGGTLSGILKNAFSFGLGMSFFSAVQQGFKATVGSALSFNDTMQQARIGFTTMLGGAQRAKTFLADLAKFAAQTPFEFQDLLRASQRMMALGFSADEVRPTLTAVGDAMAAMGKGTEGIDAVILALGQMRMAGRVNAQDMLQLTNAGIGAWEILAEAVGKTVPQTRKLAEQGKIDGRKAAAAIIEGMEKRFPGMMKKMEDSWRGVTSTIKDVFRMTLGAMTSGLFNSANEWLKKVRDTATGFYDAFQQGGLSYAVSQTFGPQAAAGIQSISTVLRGLWSTVVGVGRTIVANWSVIGPLTAWVVKGFLAFKMASIAVSIAAAAVRTFTAANLAMHGSLVKGSGLLKLVSDIVLYYQCLIPATIGTFGFSTALTYLKTALLAVQTALSAVIWPILIISGLLMGGMTLWNKYSQSVQAAAQKAQMAKMAQQQKDYVASVNKAAKGTNAQADALGELGKASKDNVQSFDEVHQIMDQTADASVPGADTQGRGGKGAGAPVIPDFEMPDFAFDMDAAIAEAKVEMGGFWGWLKIEASNAWGSVKTWAINVWAGVGTKWEGFIEWCGGFWDNVKIAGGQAWDTIRTDASALWESVKGSWGTFKEWAGGLWESVKERWGGFRSWAGETWEGMRLRASEAWEGIRIGAATGWENIKTTVAGKWDSLKIGAATTWDQVKTGAGIAWDSIKSGAGPAWDGIKTAITTKWDGLTTGAMTTWGSIKSTISEKWQALRTETPTTWDSIKAGIATRWNELMTNAPTTWESIKSSITTRFGQAKESVLTAAQSLYDKVPKSWSDMSDLIGGMKDRLLGVLANPWEKAKSTIYGIVDSAKDWGKNFIDNIIGGIQSKIAAVKRAGGMVASALAKFLGFSSPTEEGPGRYADQWAPNLMRMYTQGILANVSMVRSAAGVVAGSLTSMSAVPALVFAGMGTAGRQGGASPFTSVGGPAPEIHLHVGTLVADKGGLKQLERMLREFRSSEDQRIGQER